MGRIKFPVLKTVEPIYKSALRREYHKINCCLQVLGERIVGRGLAPAENKKS